MTQEMLSRWRRLAAVAVVLTLGGCASAGTQPAQMAAEKRSLPELMRLAEKSRTAGNMAVAADIYEKAAERYPDSPAPFIGLGRTASAKGQTQRATAAFRAALKREPESSAARLGLGKALLADDRLTAALKQFNVVIRNGAEDHRPYLAKGVTLDLLGRHEAAQSTYRDGLKVAPNNVALRNNLGLSLALAGNYRPAMRQLEAVTRDPTAPPRARQNLALVYGMAGQTRRAAAAAAEDLSPDVVERNLAYYQAIRKLRGGASRADNAAASPDTGTPESSKPESVASAAPDEPTAETPARSNGTAAAGPPDKPIQLAAAVATPRTKPAKASAGPDKPASGAPTPPKPTAAEPDGNASGEDTTGLDDGTDGSPGHPAQATASSGQAATLPAAAQTAGGEPETEQLAARRLAAIPGSVDSAPGSSKPDMPAVSSKAGAAPTTAEAVRAKLGTTPQQDSADNGPTYWAQLASFSSPESGRNEWKRLQRAYPEIIAGLPLSLQSAELPEKGTFYRVRTGPFEAKQAPSQLCEALSARGQGCLVVKR